MAEYQGEFGTINGDEIYQIRHESGRSVHCWGAGETHDELIDEVELPLSIEKEVAFRVAEAVNQCEARWNRPPEREPESCTVLNWTRDPGASFYSAYLKDGVALNFGVMRYPDGTWRGFLHPGLPLKEFQETRLAAEQAVEREAMEILRDRGHLALAEIQALVDEELPKTHVDLVEARAALKAHEGESAADAAARLMRELTRVQNELLERTDPPPPSLGAIVQTLREVSDILECKPGQSVIERAKEVQAGIAAFANRLAVPVVGDEDE